MRAERRSQRVVRSLAVLALLAALCPARADEVRIDHLDLAEANSVFAALGELWIVGTSIRLAQLTDCAWNDVKTKS